MTVRRLFGVLATLALLCSAAVFARTAEATPYPPVTGAQIAVSTTTPYVGERIEVSGTFFGPDELVDIAIHGQVVASAHADARGSFDPSVVVPAPAGQQQLTAHGRTSGLDASPILLTVRDATGGLGVDAAAAVSSGTGAGAGVGAGHSGLAFTGVQIAMLCLLAALLLGGGTAAVYAGRRRRAGARA
jgi:hypothetical protein